MSAAPYDGPVRVGELRPSQILHSFGVGALVDLPNFSVIVGGLDRWDVTKQREITEDRLLSAVRAALGDQVLALRGLPVAERTTPSPFDEWARIGVPVTVFPRWLRCTRCNRLFPVSSGALRLEESPYRPDRVRYTHPNCDKSRRPAQAVPARFVAACPRGHLDEFPWIQYCHDGVVVCANPMLQVNDVGTGGRATDLLVKCLNCGARTTLARAFGESALTTMPQCRGRHPHLGTVSNDCPEQLRTLVLGASNMWFSVSVSVLSLPVGGGSLDQLVYDNWGELSKMAVKDVLAYALAEKPALQAIFAGHEVGEIWAAVEARRAAPAAPSVAEDVRGPEWTALLNGSLGAASPHFEAEPIAPPSELAGMVAGVTLAHRLREVTALCGFTRIMAPEPDERSAAAPLEATGAPTWIPAVENRGEGVFLRLDEQAVQAWEALVDGSPAIAALWEAHRRWRTARQLVPTDGWPGARFVLLHSLAHALINEVAIRCGYSSASIRERIYSRGPGVEPMAGILLYTSAPDAEGTLGGLVNLGRAQELATIVAAALERARLCSSDPLCSEHRATSGEDALHNAACHACLLVSETSCERGNRYLDRSTLVDTFAHLGVELFT
jgi:hypothetical protein